VLFRSGNDEIVIPIIGQQPGMNVIGVSNISERLNLGIVPKNHLPQPLTFIPLTAALKIIKFPMVSERDGKDHAIDDVAWAWDDVTLA
jgi:hypothetical protein